MSKPCEYCGTDLPEGADKQTRRIRSHHFATCKKAIEHRKSLRDEPVCDESAAGENESAQQLLLDTQYERDALMAEVESLRRQLAISTARNQQWHEAVLLFRSDQALERAHKVQSTEGYGAMERLLDPQLDAGVLEQIKAECVAAGGEAMRRRAMNACDALYNKSEWASEDHPTAANAEEEIRSLPGIKIEDLERENDTQPESTSRPKPRLGRV